MAHENVTDEELAELIRRTAEAASALIRGDIRTYLTLIPHADDYTLMDPFGGEPTRGFDPSSENLEAMERFFQGGEAELEVVESYTSGDLVGGDRTAAWPSRWSARPGPVAPGDLGLSP